MPSLINFEWTRDYGGYVVQKGPIRGLDFVPISVAPEVLDQTDWVIGKTGKLENYRPLNVSSAIFKELAEAASSPEGVLLATKLLAEFCCGG